MQLRNVEGSVLLQRSLVIPETALNRGKLEGWAPAEQTPSGLPCRVL